MTIRYWNEKQNNRKDSIDITPNSTSESFDIKYELISSQYFDGCTNSVSEQPCN